VSAAEANEVNQKYSIALQVKTQYYAILAARESEAAAQAQLSQAECETELRARQIDFIRETAGPVLAPVRLTGPLHGVVFRSDASDKARATSPYEIVDCRLVLALDDFAAILNRHDIVEVRHYSMYRPPKPLVDGEIGKRHPGALAIDAGRFYDRSGGELDVNRDFHGAIGAKTCGEGAAPNPATDAAGATRPSRSAPRSAARRAGRASA